jgi:hypothetical protein
MEHNKVDVEIGIDHLVPGLQRYLSDHIETGSFLRAVLSNDLCEACARAADLNTLLSLPLLVVYLQKNLPEQCWGSPEKVEAWLALRELSKAIKVEAQDPDSITSLLLRGGAFQDDKEG